MSSSTTENAETERARASAAFEQLMASPSVTLLVAETEGRVVGTVKLVIVPNLTHNPEPWAQVENMVVEETARGAGIGRQLLETCLTVAREAGCYKTRLQSANQRTDAHRFYEALGFEDSSAGFRRYL